MTKNILAVGAYERNNLGDFLFFLVLKMALAEKDCNIVAGSIIDSDMRGFIGEYVLPYHFLLSNYSWDVVWVVGGEVGGLGIGGALEMSLDEKKFAVYSRSSDSVKSKIKEYLSVIMDDQLAYLPNLGLYEKNRYSLLVLNSVGGFERLANFSNKDIVSRIFEAIKKATLLTVRNNYSKEYLNNNGIVANLSPDVVHVLPYFYKCNTKINEDYFLFQINEYLIGQYSIENIASALLGIIRKYDIRVFLFTAGSARYHDSMHGYIKIKEYINNFYNENRVEIIKDENPLRLVDWIVNAKLWIGSSLHGRILSIAYGVPRVSLRVKKTSEYSELWDNKFPYDIELENLIGSCEDAFNIEKCIIDDKSKELSKKAKDNLDDIVAKIYEN